MSGWAAAGQAAGSVIGGLLSFYGSRERNRANKDIAQRQMQFQERLSSTAYQRSMQDMRAAGLNPLLAYKQGGASAPAGAGIPAVDELTPAVSSALQASTAVAQLRKSNAETSLIKQQEKLADANTAKSLLSNKRMERTGDSAFGRNADSLWKTGKTIFRGLGPENWMRKEKLPPLSSHKYKFRQRPPPGYKGDYYYGGKRYTQ